jgi:hypothetical protein
MAKQFRIFSEVRDPDGKIDQSDVTDRSSGSRPCVGRMSQIAGVPEPQSLEASMARGRFGLVRQLFAPPFANHMLQIDLTADFVDRTQTSVA